MNCQIIWFTIKVDIPELEVDKFPPPSSSLLSSPDGPCTLNLDHMFLGQQLKVIRARKGGFSGRGTE